jgi:hypothetical protein
MYFYQIVQIGRIFAQLAIVYCRHLLENFRATLFRGWYNALILTKKWLGHILATFFTNSSGHPDFYVHREPLELWVRQDHRECQDSLDSRERRDSLVVMDSKDFQATLDAQVICTCVVPVAGSCGECDMKMMLNLT